MSPQLTMRLGKHERTGIDLVDVYYGDKQIARIIGVDESDCEDGPDRPEVEIVVYSEHLAMIDHITSLEYGGGEDVVGIKFHFDANR